MRKESWEVEELAEELLHKINNLCISYHYFKQTDVAEQGVGLSAGIQQFASVLMEGNIFGMEEREQAAFQNYVLQVLKDYTQAAVQRDAVLMVDTLDYGLRELLNIFADPKDGESRDA